jgi:hypothetical protein
MGEGVVDPAGWTTVARRKRTAQKPWEALTSPRSRIRGTNQSHLRGEAAFLVEVPARIAREAEGVGKDQEEMGGGGVVEVPLVKLFLSIFTESFDELSGYASRRSMLRMATRHRSSTSPGASATHAYHHDEAADLSRP